MKQHGPPEDREAVAVLGGECEPTRSERDGHTLPAPGAWRRRRPGGCTCAWCLFPWWELSHCARCGDELPMSRRQETAGRILVCQRCEENISPARRILTIGQVHWSILPPEVRGALTGWLIWHGYGTALYEPELWPIWRLEAVRTGSEQLGVWLEFGPAYLPRDLPLPPWSRLLGRFGDKNIVGRGPVLLPPPANPVHLEAAARALGCAW